MNEISANEVMKLLNAKNCFEGVDLLKKRFGSASKLSGYQEFLG